MVQFLCTYFFKESEHIHLNSIYSRPENTTWQYWTLPYVPGQRMADHELYILTSPHTFSGAEEFAYNMKTLKRGTIIGERTGGGANPGDYEARTDGYYMKMASGTPINPVTNENWEGVGVEPHMSVPYEQALEYAHREALKKLISLCDNTDEKNALKEYAEEIEFKYSPVEVQDIHKHAGSYENITIRYNRGCLYYCRKIREFNLIPLSSTTFSIEDAEFPGASRIEFIIDKENNADQLILSNSCGIIGTYMKQI